MRDNGNGYLYFTVSDKKLEKPKNYYQHRFVYEVFKGPIPRCLEIDHINNIKKDNRIKNLQLLNHKPNIEKSKNKPIISINIKTGKKKNIFLLKQLQLNQILMLQILQKFVGKKVNQQLLKKMVKNTLLSTYVRIFT